MKPENSSLICVERDRDREEQVEIYRRELFVCLLVGASTEPGIHLHMMMQTLDKPSMERKEIWWNALS